jgi:hypothetical protein
MSESKIPKKNQFSSQYFAKFGFCQMVSQFHLGNMLIFGIVHFPIVSQFATKVHTQTTTTSVMRQQQHQIRNGSVRGIRRHRPPGVHPKVPNVSFSRRLTTFTSAMIAKTKATERATAERMVSILHSCVCTLHFRRIPKTRSQPSP